jgi:hypothetical protein
MQSVGVVRVSFGSALLLVASLAIAAHASLADDSYVPAPSSAPRFVGSRSFFPPRPSNAQIHYRTGVLIAFGAGMHSGGAAIRDGSGQVFSYFTGWPMFIEGKQTHCAIPPTARVRFDPTFCDGGWPADMIVGVTRVRIYYWHDVTPWGKHVVVTDQIIKAP